MSAASRWSAVVMLTDMVGYSTLAERDEDRALQLLDEHRRLLRPVFERHGGREVKTIGDAFLVEFSSALKATQCAVEVQRSLLERNRRSGSDPIDVRIGIHMGEMVHQEGDVFGHAVNAVSRITPLAEPGGICVSGAIFDRVHHKLDWTFTEVGPAPLKGFSFPPALFRLELPWFAPPIIKAVEPTGLRVDAGRPSRIPSLVDREREYDALKEFVESVTQSAGGAFFLHGEAGIGKTRLVRELRSYVNLRGIRTFVGNCVEVDLGMPYAPWVEVFHRIVAEETSENLAKFCGSSGGELARLAPEIAGKISPLPTFAAAGPPHERLRFFQGVTEFLVKLAESQPVLVILEDLDGADSDSLQLLRHVVRGAKETPLGVVGTFREANIAQPGPLNDCLAAINQERLLRTAELPRLRSFDVGRLIGELLGARAESLPSFAPLIYQKTGGNPFFVEEVIYALLEDGALVRDDGSWRLDKKTDIALPPSVRKIILHRLARLDRASLDVLRLASVIGEEFDFELLRRLARKTEKELVDILDRALRAGLLQEERRRAGRTICGFRERQIRDTLYEELSLGRRRLYHRQVARGIESTFRGSPATHSAELAHHYLLANDPSGGVKYSIQAADQAAGIYAYEDAAGHLRNALELLEQERRPVTRAEILQKLGDALTSSGHFSSAIPYFREAANLYREFGQVRKAEDLLGRALMAAWELSTDTQTYFEIYEEARSLLEKAGKGPEAARFLGNASIGFLWFGRRAEGRSMARRALRMARELKLPDVEMMAHSALCTWVPISQQASGLVSLERWEAIERRQGAPIPASVVADQYVGAAFAEISGRGNWKSAIRLLEKARETARDARLFDRVAYLQYILSQFYFESGQTDLGRSACDEVVSLVEKYRFSDASLYLDALSNRLYYDGELVEARTQLLKSLEQVRQIAPQHKSLIGFYQFAGLISHDLGETQAALTYLEQCKELAQYHEMPLDQAHWVVAAYDSLVEILAVSGQFDRAQRNLEELRALVSALNHDVARGHYKRAEGFCFARQGSETSSIRAFEEAAKTWERAGWSYWHAIARYDLAVALQKKRRRKQARLQLEQALALFRSMRASQWINRTVTQLGTESTDAAGHVASTRRTRPPVSPISPGRKE